MEDYNQLLNRNLRENFYSKYGISREDIHVSMVEFSEDRSLSWTSAYYKILINSSVEIIWFREESSDNLVVDIFEYRCDGNDFYKREKNVIKFVIGNKRMYASTSEFGNSGPLGKISKEIKDYLNSSAGCDCIVELIYGISKVCTDFFNCTYSKSMDGRWATSSPEKYTS
jgi:hypothetical protein